MKDRLIELVDKAKEEYASDVTDHTETDYIVECLLNEGVIVPPCKVVYSIVWEGTQFAFVEKKSIDLLKIYELKNLKKYGYYLTKEEAEAELEKRGKENA